MILDTPVFYLNEDDICNPIISFEHESGCAVADAMNILDFLTRNPWVIAILCIYLGPFINFFGRKFLPWVIGVSTGVLAFFIVFIFAGMVGLADYFYY